MRTASESVPRSSTSCPSRASSTASFRCTPRWSKAIAILTRGSPTRPPRPRSRCQAPGHGRLGLVLVPGTGTWPVRTGPRAWHRDLSGLATAVCLAPRGRRDGGRRLHSSRALLVQLGARDPVPAEREPDPESLLDGHLAGLAPDLRPRERDECAVVRGLVPRWAGADVQFRRALLQRDLPD